LRLGVYADMRYRADVNGVSSHHSFLRFLTALPPRVEELVFFGRPDPDPGRSPYDLAPPCVRFVPLLHYKRGTPLGPPPHSLGRVLAAFAPELDRIDTLWAFGPDPVALALALMARRRGTPVALGVRQDYPSYVRHHLPNKRWIWVLPVAHALERSFRALARSSPTIAVGEDLAARYRGGRAPVLATGFCTVSRSDVVSSETALAKPWAGELRLLSVGRVDHEKNPLLLVDVIAGLHARNPAWRLEVVGDGPLRPALEERIRARRLDGVVKFHGRVPNGPRLWAVYRRCHAFLHTSLTEGLPHVVFEAQAAGLPLVATAIGGVPAALDGGRSGMLVPPKAAAPAIAALERLAADGDLRQRLIEVGLANAASNTMEAQLDRIATFLRENAVRGEPARRATVSRASVAKDARGARSSHR
jgi:glycosyltransferase involved in cell wall biosynthesis